MLLKAFGEGLVQPFRSAVSGSHGGQSRAVAPLCHPAGLGAGQARSRDLVREKDALGRQGQPAALVCAAPASPSAGQSCDRGCHTKLGPGRGAMAGAGHTKLARGRVAMAGRRAPLRTAKAARARGWRRGAPCRPRGHMAAAPAREGGKREKGRTKAGRGRPAGLNAGAEVASRAHRAA